MNFSQVALLSFGCILGLLACGIDGQYYMPYPYYQQRGGGGGGGGFLWLIGLLFIIVILFGGFFNRGVINTGMTVINATG